MLIVVDRYLDFEGLHTFLASSDTGTLSARECQTWKWSKSRYVDLIVHISLKAMLVLGTLRKVEEN